MPKTKKKLFSINHFGMYLNYMIKKLDTVYKYTGPLSLTKYSSYNYIIK